MADADEQFRRFFRAATTFGPYDWQVKVAIEGLPTMLPIPTGLGKTEGSVLAWAWRRFARKRSEPLHLVYCLPMRSLVRQTTQGLQTCFARLKSWDDSIQVPVYQLIGGDVDEEWAKVPDRPWVLVGTQDMLLSRALKSRLRHEPLRLARAFWSTEPGLPLDRGRSAAHGTWSLDNGPTRLDEAQALSRVEALPHHLDECNHGRTIPTDDRSKRRRM